MTGSGTAFWVNEGPSVLQACGKVFVSFSASDTSAAYCMGMMWMNEADDPMDISAWHKLSQPVFTTDAGKGIYGPGHNTFFEKDGEAYTSYHARPYDEIVGDPLYDPNRHTFIMKLPMKDGFPVFSLEKSSVSNRKVIPKTKAMPYNTGQVNSTAREAGKAACTIESRRGFGLSDTCRGCRQSF